MRMMMIYRPYAPESDAPPTEEEMAAMGAFIGELAASGVLIATDGLVPSSKGAKVKLKGGKVTIVDGPFAEAKEIIAGFAIVRVDSKQQAIELGERFLRLAGDGEQEIREMYDVPAYPPE